MGTSAWGLLISSARERSVVQRMLSCIYDFDGSSQEEKDYFGQIYSILHSGVVRNIGLPIENDGNKAVILNEKKIIASWDNGNIEKWINFAEGIRASKTILEILETSRSFIIVPSQDSGNMVK
jgi:hypothetical protein